MFMRIFMGIILILAFLMLYSPFMSLWTDSTSGFNHLMTGITTANGSPGMTDLETSIWGLFPLVILLLGVGGLVWLMVRDH